jgi:NAD(P)-dependent dehydrogenase (short-subunit alcohol dehydrogenase family)
MPEMPTSKRAVVTGGANGIGQAFSKRLAPQGAKVVVADIADGAETVGAIKKTGGSAIGVRCDQTSEADVNKLRDAVERELGGCDILVHCAGIYPTAAIDEITFDQWRKVLSVNLDSVFLLVKAFLPGMKERGWGRIISVSSTTFHSGIGFNTHYTASKGGLIGFARSLASEVGDFGITCARIDANRHDDQRQARRVRLVRDDPSATGDQAHRNAGRPHRNAGLPHLR